MQHVTWAPGRAPRSRTLFPTDSRVSRPTVVDCTTGTCTARCFAACRCQKKKKRFPVANGIMAELGVAGATVEVSRHASEPLSLPRSILPTAVPLITQATYGHLPTEYRPYHLLACRMGGSRRLPGATKLPTHRDGTGSGVRSVSNYSTDDARPPCRVRFMLAAPTPGAGRCLSCPARASYAVPTGARRARHAPAAHLQETLVFIID